MLLTIHGNGWSTTFAIINNGDDFSHVSADVRGNTEESALQGAEDVLALLAAGREAYIRVKPEAHSDFNFDTKEHIHRGFVRFSYRLIPGEWHYPNMTEYVSLAGF